MFCYCRSLIDLDVSIFDFTNFTSLGLMFYDWRNLVTIYSNSDWNVGVNKDSTEMFRGCLSLVGDISYDSTKFDISMANLDGYFTKKPTL